MSCRQRREKSADEAAAEALERATMRRLRRIYATFVTPYERRRQPSLFINIYAAPYEPASVSLFVSPPPRH